MKPQIKSANRPRQIRGKWSHSFERYCKVQLRVGHFNAFLAQEGDNIRTSISSEVQNYILRTAQGGEVENSNIKNSAYFCHSAHVLRISY